VYVNEAKCIKVNSKAPVWEKNVNSWIHGTHLETPSTNCVRDFFISKGNLKFLGAMVILKAHITFVRAIVLQNLIILRKYHEIQQITSYTRVVQKWRIIDVREHYKNRWKITFLPCSKAGCSYSSITDHR
jgi:hypothetical protein